MSMKVYTIYILWMLSYPSDVYDRIWAPRTLAETPFTLVRSSAFIIDTANVSDNPPQDAVRNAATLSSNNASSLLRMSMGWSLVGLDSSPSLVYVNLYFSEVSMLNATTDIRSIYVYVDDQLVNSTVHGLVPPYGSVAELTITNVTASGSTVFRLVPASNSTLPPILNAIEVFKVIDYKLYSPPLSPAADTTKKASKLPIILGVEVPGFLLLVAFVVVVMVMMMKQKQHRAAQGSTTTTGGGNGQGSAASHNNYNYDNNMMGPNIGVLSRY